MLAWVRRLSLIAVAALFFVAAVTAFGKAHHGGPLTGTWTGYISGTGFARRHIVITVNRKETAGSWRISSSCYGPERLDSISNGYHHYLRKLGRGAHCGLAGDIDCLKRAGARAYDAVTTHAGGAYNVQGTLRRVRPASRA
jgi:hypothetical protein